MIDCATQGVEMGWLQDNAELVSAMATVLMTIAWVTYAQFGILTYIKQRRPRIIIDQTADHSLNTRFVIVNLSELPIYISGIMVCVRRGEDETIHKINRFQRTSSSDDEDDAGSQSAEDVEAQLRHGTLDVGQLFLIGSSKETLSWLLTDDDETVDQPFDQRLRGALAEIDDFEFRVVAMAGTEDHSVASARTFQIEYEEDEIRIVPANGSTRHYSSWRYRHVAREWSEQLRQMHS
jgi:hypothetical protein